MKVPRPTHSLIFALTLGHTMACGADGSTDATGDNESTSDGSGDADAGGSVDGDSGPGSDDSSGNADADDVDDSDDGDDSGNADDSDDPVDCANLPTSAVDATFLDHVPGCEDFTFDNVGNIICITMEGRNLMQVPYSGDAQLLVPNVAGGGGGGGGGGGFGGWIRGHRFMLDGALVVADPPNNAVVKLWLDGNYETLTPNMTEPNGIDVDRDGFVYLARLSGQIVRIDPSTGSATVLYETASGQRFDGIALSPDEETLYFDEENAPVVHRMTLHDDGTADSPEELATISTSGGMGFLDGVTVDACGNVYVVEMSGRVHRVSPDGESMVIVDVSTGGGGLGGICAVNFGSGVGGWKNDAIYIMQLMGGMHEASVGVVGKQD